MQNAELDDERPDGRQGWIPGRMADFFLRL